MEITPQREKWPGTMSDRERFNNQIHFRSVDRCFNREFGYWAENYLQWQDFVDNGVTTEAEADIYFNFDKMHIVSGNNWLHPAFEKRVVSETDDKQIIINPDGLYAELPKDGHSTIPHFTKSSIRSPADWETVKRERFSIEDPARLIDIESLKKLHPNERNYPLGINCGSMIGKVRDMLTFEGISYAVYDYPEMVEDIIESASRMVEHALDQLLPHFQFDYASGWEDICFKNGPIISVDFFTSVVVPRYARIGKKLAEYGVDIWYTDCDGDVRPLIPGFLEGGINTMFPFEVNGSGHPGETLEKYAGSVRIMGGVDKTKLIAGRQATEVYLKSLVPYVEKGGFIPFCDHRCPPDVDYGDYLYYLDLKQDLFGA